MAVEVELFDVGSIWAYRKRRVDPLEPVKVLKRGTTRPKWLLVRFERADAEGLEEWVPMTRLKVPWDEVTELREKEARWAAVEAAASPSSEAEVEAVGIISDACLDSDVFSYWEGKHRGVGRIKDPVELSRLLGTSQPVEEPEPTSFVEDGDLIVPWTTTLRIAQGVAPLYAPKILRVVQEYEDRLREYELKAAATRPEVSPFWAARDQVEKDTYAAIREWCGEEAVDQWQELLEARAEIARLNDLLNKTIERLEHYGHSASANTVRRHRDKR